MGTPECLPLGRGARTASLLGNDFLRFWPLDPMDLL